mmetsp:Transcript_14950/g.56300  ORF Transcript_14950/g.56300 Transcript_14950/m.56300 type:complete len:229 (+) Transcript_14950:1225-1911(+)
MPAAHRLPRPVACVSRRRPPVPVSAPGKGATPEGKLCVSAVRRRWRVRGVGTSRLGAPGCSGSSTLERKPSITEELSKNAMTLLCAWRFCGSATTSMRLCGISSPSMTMRPLKNQWRLCSLLLWLKSKSSTVVGSRFTRFTNRSSRYATSAASNERPCSLLSRSMAAAPSASTGTVRVGSGENADANVRSGAATRHSVILSWTRAAAAAVSSAESGAAPGAALMRKRR